MSILLYTDLRTDDNGNQQYNTIPNEQKKIINNMVLLDELPEAFTRVIVTPPSGDEAEMIEIDLRQPITNINQYKVNYNSPNAVIYFHPDREGQTMHFAYTGMGLIYIDGSRVVTLYENGTIKEVLSDLVENVRQVIQNAIDTQNTITTEINNLADQIQSDEVQRQNNESVRQVNETIRQDLYTKVKTETLVVYKPDVSSYSAIATTYPNAEVGWSTQVNNGDGTISRYRYNGTQWVKYETYFDSGRVVISSTQPTSATNMWIKKIN
jgi:FtsZ-binding cell division protein ZapB